MGVLGRVLEVFRGVKLPDDARITLGEAERVTAVGRLVDGTPVVTTNFGIWLADSARLEWDLVHKARWNEPVLALTPGRTVVPLDPTDPSLAVVVADIDALELRLAAAGQVPAEVQARVVRSVAYSVHHELPTYHGVWVIARRVPGRDGLHWSVRFDDVAAVDDAVALGQAAALVRAAQAELEPST